MSDVKTLLGYLLSFGNLFSSLIERQIPWCRRGELRSKAYYYASQSLLSSFLCSVATTLSNPTLESRLFCMGLCFLGLYLFPSLFCHSSRADIMSQDFAEYRFILTLFNPLL